MKKMLKAAKRPLAMLLALALTLCCAPCVSLVHATAESSSNPGTVIDLDFNNGVNPPFYKTTKKDGSTSQVTNETVTLAMGENSENKALFLNKGDFCGYINNTMAPYATSYFRFAAGLTGEKALAETRPRKVQFKFKAGTQTGGGNVISFHPLQTNAYGYFGCKVVIRVNHTNGVIDFSGGSAYYQQFKFVGSLPNGSGSIPFTPGTSAEDSNSPWYTFTCTYDWSNYNAANNWQVGLTCSITGEKGTATLSQVVQYQAPTNAAYDPESSNFSNPAVNDKTSYTVGIEGTGSTTAYFGYVDDLHIEALSIADYQAFQTAYSGISDLSAGTITKADKAAVDAVLEAYNALDDVTKSACAAEKAYMDSLVEALNTLTDGVVIDLKFEDGVNPFYKITNKNGVTSQVSNDKITALATESNSANKALLLSKGGFNFNMTANAPYTTSQFSFGAALTGENAPAGTRPTKVQFKFKAGTLNDSQNPPIVFHPLQTSGYGYFGCRVGIHVNGASTQKTIGFNNANYYYQQFKYVGDRVTTSGTIPFTPGTSAEDSPWYTFTCTYDWSNYNAANNWQVGLTYSITDGTNNTITLSQAVQYQAPINAAYDTATYSNPAVNDETSYTVGLEGVNSSYFFGYVDDLHIEALRINTYNKFLNDNAAILAKTEGTVTAEDLTAIEKALADYADLDAVTKSALSSQKTLLDAMYAKVAEGAGIAKFRADHAEILAQTAETVQDTDAGAITAALNDYAALSEADKTELAAEKALLDSLENVLYAPAVLGATMSTAANRIQFNSQMGRLIKADTTIVRYGTIFTYTQYVTGENPKLTMAEMTYDSESEYLYVTGSSVEITAGQEFYAQTFTIRTENYGARVIARSYVAYADGSVYYSDNTTGSGSVANAIGVENGYCSRSIISISKSMMKFLYEHKDKENTPDSIKNSISNYITKDSETGKWTWTDMAKENNGTPIPQYLVANRDDVITVINNNP